MKCTFLKTNLGIFAFCLLILGFGHVSKGSTLPMNIEPLPVCDWEAPQNLHTTSITPVTVSLAWNIPITGAAPGGYQVKTILVSTGAVVNTVKTSNLSQTISGLTMGTEYRFELSSICAGGEVSSRLVGITIITVYVDEIINTECPETPNSYTPTGSFYNAVLNSTNTWDDITAIPFNISSTTNQLYFWHFYLPNNAVRYTKFIIVRELPIGTYNMYHFKKKEIPGTTWSSRLETSDQTIRIKNQSNTDIAKIVFDENVFKVSRIGSGSFNVKADISCICNADISNPSCTINSFLSEETSDNEEFTLEPVYIGKAPVTLATINIYPNPVNDRLFLKFPDPLAVPFSVSVSDLNGKIIKTNKYTKLQDILSTSISFDIQDVPNGVYYIIISSSVNNIVERFIKIN